MKNTETISLIIYGNQKHADEVSMTETQKICARLANGFTAFAYYHSHKSQRKGGRFSPHIHLVIAIPKNEFRHWQDNVELGFKTSGLDLNFTLCNIRDPRAKVCDLSKLMNYLVGDKRVYLPEPIYWTPDWFDFETSVSGRSHLEARDAA